MVVNFLIPSTFYFSHIIPHTLREMPVPTQLNQVYTLFPTLTREQIDAARTSAWYDTFADITFPAKFIDLRELGEEEEFLRVSSGSRIYSVWQYVNQ